MASSEAGRFRVLQVYPVLCRRRAMHFTQPTEIDEMDSGRFQSQGR